MPEAIATATATNPSHATPTREELIGAEAAATLRRFNELLKASAVSRGLSGDALAAMEAEIFALAPAACDAERRLHRAIREHSRRRRRAELRQHRVAG